MSSSSVTYFENKAIVAEGLIRRFGTVAALDGLNLSVPGGSFFALVGSNGAGKSTTVRVLSGLLAPTSGRVRILGLDPVEQGRALRSIVGVVPDFPVLYEVLTPRENISRLSRLRGVCSKEISPRLEELAEALSLEDYLDQPVKGLSQGTRKKASLAAALIHGPSLLFLDEPFEGIDPIAAHGIRCMLNLLRERGVTVFLTSHILPLVESLATHVAIIDEGRVRVCGDLEQVMGAHPSLEHAILDQLGAPREIPKLEWYLP